MDARELISAIDALLVRAARDVALAAPAGAVAVARARLQEVAGRVDAGDLPGLPVLAQIVRRIAAGLTPADLDTGLGVIDQAWREWKAGLPAAIAGDPDPDPALAEDALAMQADPELASMFVAEAVDHLNSVEVAILELESRPGDRKILNDIFRPFHTVKGNAGALGLRAVQEFAHKVENLLDAGRSGRHHIGAAEVEVVLRSVDLLTAMISDLGLRTTGGPGQGFRGERDALMSAIDALLDRTGRAAAPAVESADAPARPRPDGDATPTRPETAAERDAPAIARHRAGGDDGVDALVKVDTRKLDSLVDMVGELVIVQSIIHAHVGVAGADDRLARHLAQFRRITSELQRNAMSMRMVPIRQTFQKMARLVRDLSKTSSKPVELVVAGEDTELDRKVVEDITDPLMHMIRNGIDHGIEPPAVRAAAGKPRQGRLSLSASHEAGNILIAVADDGAGLDLERIQRRAIAQGLVRDGEPLSPADIQKLIFRAGFSTAEHVTEISGRGVGMDVVRRNIEMLRGRVDIQSTPGQGTTFFIRLPLTLAILEGLVLRVAGERFVVPTFSVRESLRPARQQIHAVHGKARLIQVRDLALPLVHLGELFGLAGAEPEPWNATVVVMEDNGRQVGVVVDQLIGNQEVVIKSLGEMFARVRGVAGGAILGDGRIGLILDAGGIVQLMTGAAAMAA